ncbi:MAG: alanine racemase, partial [bacterium]|nr:alanine racemase [bacterium]
MKYRSWAEIDLKRLTENIHKIQKFLKPGTKYLQVVKADAYGHGAIEVSRTALNNNAYYLGVANADEGIQLRLAEIYSPVLVLSPSTSDEIEYLLNYNITSSVSSFEFAKVLDESAKKQNKKVNIHIEVDSGMGRTGITIDSAEKEILRIAGLKNILIEGIFSHFPSSEIPEDPFAHIQVNEFKQLLLHLKEKKLTIPLIHFANSGGILNYPRSHFNMVRAGLLTFGEYPGGELKKIISVKPVMSFKTQVVLLKKFKKGDTISYNRSYKLKNDSLIAVLPIGYGDGYDFLLSNKGTVLIKGNEYPIVGRVTMDLTMIDIGKNNSIKIGDEAILIGKSGKKEITAEDIAKKIGTINYNILCSVGKRAPRIYLNQEKLKGFQPIFKRKDITDDLISKDKLDEVIKHSLQLRLNEEVGNSLYHGLFQTIFGQGDEPIIFRRGFFYHIRFKQSRNKDFYDADITIGYEKIFKENEFIIACADSEEALEKLFSDPKVEYRWLIQGKNNINFNDFKLNKVLLNRTGLKINEKNKTSRGLEYLIKLPEKLNLLHKSVEFQLQFTTIHPVSKREFP